jgi:hypothetical protein
MYQQLKYSNCNELLGAGIAQWYSAGLQVAWLGVQGLAGAGNFPLHHHVQTGSGAHPASYPMALSLAVKWPGHEADHSPPSSSEVKNVWHYTSDPPTYLHGMAVS